MRELDIRREHRIGRCEDRTEQNRRAEGQAQRYDADKRDQADRHAGDEIQREVARGVVAQALNAPRDPLFGHARAENLKSKPLRAAV